MILSYGERVSRMMHLANRMMRPDW